MNPLDRGSTRESRRVPAEWEPHEATWMQWPKSHEAPSRRDFSMIINALQEYEPINLVVESIDARSNAQEYLLRQGVPLTNITWHVMPYDWAWMRDNGPVWVEVDGDLIVQDWDFNAWSELDPRWENDNAVPCRVAEIVSVRCESYDLIYERGTLEFNGSGALIASWSVMSDRNDDQSREDIEALFKKAFGVNQIIWLMSGPKGDITGGHVDGIARFINENTVVVAQHVDQSDFNARIYEEAASIIEEAGFEVVRLDIPGYVTYKGIRMPAIYVNWLVANDVVIMTKFGVAEWDNNAKAAVEGFFPGRDVVLVETLELWYRGGGIHCITNDQPAE